MALDYLLNQHQTHIQVDEAKIHVEMKPRKSIYLKQPV